MVWSMVARVDVAFEFHKNTSAGKDPDLFSPTLREYHRSIWSMQLPSGQMRALTSAGKVYFQYESSFGKFALSIDAITTKLKGRASKIAKQIPADPLPPDFGYTIGSSIIFPGNRIDGASTINGARGFHPRIADRFDLTLECIRRHYRGESSPLASALQRSTSSSSSSPPFLGM